MKTTGWLSIGAIGTIAVLSLAGVGPLAKPAGRYTVTCYDPGGAGDSQLVAEWSGLSHTTCDRTACTMGTRYHETVYVIPQGIACAVEKTQ